MARWRVAIDEDVAVGRVCYEPLSLEHRRIIIAMLFTGETRLKEGTAGSHVALNEAAYKRAAVAVRVGDATAVIVPEIAATLLAAAYKRAAVTVVIFDCITKCATRVFPGGATRVLILI
jgi:hypothetical protein